jgi:hypothetical protein
MAARWAVFFDCLGIPYQYEPNEYERATHIPDFFLPRMDFTPDNDRYKGTFLEVKDAYPTNREIEPATCLKDRTGLDVYMFYGSTFQEGLFCWGARGKEVSCKDTAVQDNPEVV